VHSDPHWGVKALDFVDAVERATTPADVEICFRASIAQAGFGTYLMCGLPDAKTEFRNRVIANGWPAEWSQLYVADNFAGNDPVERHCLRSVDPFEWRHAPFDPQTEPAARTIMQRAADFGMKQGFCVPIHYGDGSGAGVSIAGERPDFGPGVRPAMHLMALYAHHRVRSLVRRPKPRVDPILTKREREVVQWALAGKTDWEIGVILKISERTARAHMASAAKKLHAGNRTSTVVQALRCGEISL
jgi:LuxR family quorum sensing-dependent transcriptional regulator